MSHQATQQLENYLSLFEIPAGYLNIASYQSSVTKVGGVQYAQLMIQGCMRACTDCPFPESMAMTVNQLIRTDQLVQKILSVPSHVGLLLTGGEPFWQAATLAALTAQVKVAGLTIVAYTCFTIDQLQSDYAPAGAQELLRTIDLLVEGAYDPAQAIADPQSWAMSRNQVIHQLSPIHGEYA